MSNLKKVKFIQSDIYTKLSSEQFLMKVMYWSKGFDLKFGCGVYSEVITCLGGLRRLMPK